MRIDAKTLQACLFFQDKTIDQINLLLETMHYSVKEYSKNEPVVFEGDTADRIGIVLTGQVEVQKTQPSGNAMTITRLQQGQTFGEAVLFSKANVYPAYVIAPATCTVLFISKQEILRLCASDIDILSRYMENLSERLLMLNRKIEVLSLGSLRQRIASYLLQQSGRPPADKVVLPFSKRVWAEHLNAARPSLSREIGLLRNNGLIDFEGNTFYILNRKGLEELLK